MQGVLSGIRVLDLGRHISGPVAALMLADFGAEVIRVERPGGEEDRFMGLPSDSEGSYSFMNYARNKKAITLDFINNDDGLKILKKLVEKCDIVIHNFSPVAIKRIGICYETLREINAGLIYVEISGFGGDGPYAHRLGFDQIAQAMSGAMSLTGQPEQPPQRSEVRYCDFSTGFFGAYGVALALIERAKTGKGQKIEANLLRTAVFLNAAPVTEYRATGKLRRRLGNRSWYTGTSDLFKTRDGQWVFISTVTRGLFVRLCRLLDREDLLEREDLRNDYNRFLCRKELDAVLSEWVSDRSAEELAHALDEARLPYGFVHDVDEVDTDPGVLHEKMFVRKTTLPGEEVALAGVPFHMRDTPGSVRTAPPAVGQHNQEIYGEVLGLSELQIEELHSNNVI